MKLKDFSKLWFTHNFTMPVWLLQCANCRYEFKVKLNLKYHMHYAHLISKNKAKFVLLKSKKPKRVFSYCMYSLLTFFSVFEKSKKISLEFSLSSSATTLEARILATCSKWPEFCHLAQIFVFWLACLHLFTGNNAKFGKFSQKVGGGSRDLGQDPKFFRTYMGGVLQSQ